ncbi:CvpA family protein [Bartonella sp. DGB2]|uniref:CvpA family protein n=1 Tax=Bartonella sp. DGB2 TaxID=3388426 RepID=UPI00398FAB89
MATGSPSPAGESSHDAFIRFSTLLVIFISFCTLFSYIGTYLAKKIHLIFKTKVNQIGGIIYGILRGIFVMVLFTLLFEAYPQEGWFSHALVKPFLDTIGAKLLQIIPSGSIYILYEIFNGTS